jgi:hypothetical protein
MRPENMKDDLETLMPWLNLEDEIFYAEKISAKEALNEPLLFMERAWCCKGGGYPVVFVRRENGGKLYEFRTGVVVTKQLEEARLPTWATMRMVKGKTYHYYKLDMFETVSVERTDILSGSTAPLPTPAKDLCKQKAKPKPSP